MTSIQISVKKSVYDTLKRAKLEDESFSDVIERLLSEKSNRDAFLNLYGIAHDENDADALNALEAGRKALRAMMNARFSIKNED